MSDTPIWLNTAGVIVYYIKLAIPAVIALAMLIFVHELGHYLAARLVNVKVLVFSLGFGKKLFKFQRGDTEYALSIVPLGGYVKLLGEAPDEEVPQEEIAKSYSHKSPYARILIAFSGPFFNVLFAVLIYFLIFATGYPVASTSPQIGEVMKGYPAYEAGLRVGDIVTDIGGKPVKDWADLQRIVQEAELSSLKFGITREGKRTELLIAPKEYDNVNVFGEVKGKVKRIGVGPSTEIKRDTLTGAASQAFGRTYYLSKLTVLGIVKLIQGSVSPKSVGGPILIFQIAGESAKQGRQSFLQFVAIIGINLAVVNLLPIPILDGGHILFYLIEIVTRRKPSQRTIEIAQKVGLTILVLVMALAVFNDIDRIVDVKKLFKRFGGGG